jgi:hypothetical protein
MYRCTMRAWCVIHAASPISRLIECASTLVARNRKGKSASSRRYSAVFVIMIIIYNIISLRPDGGDFPVFGWHALRVRLSGCTLFFIVFPYYYPLVRCCCCTDIISCILCTKYSTSIIHIIKYRACSRDDDYYNAYDVGIR